MILQFPNLDSLKIAITSELVSQSIQAAPVRVAFLGDLVLVEPSKPIKRGEMSELVRLGVEKKRSVKAEYRDLINWYEALPLTPVEEDAIGEKSEVLFELSGDDTLANVVGEMLRLGNDRQSFRYVGENGSTRALLRVTGPPYYTMLRALDDEAHARTDGDLVAYVQQGPRVWIEAGWRHPFGDRIEPAPGQWLLVSQSAPWRFIDEGHFRDVYKLLKLELPNGVSTFQETEPEQKIQVNLQLAAGGSSDAPELWVLTKDAMRQTESLIRRSDDRLISRLAFAVTHEADVNDGQPVVIIRARPSKHAPPILVLDGDAMRPYLRIPNLFVPVTSRIHPPLRRDAVTSLLASDGELITWLMPAGEDSFVPQSISDGAFRPLEDWVDYVLDHDQQELKAWMASHQFDFESFVCGERGAEEKPKRTDKRDDKTKDTAKASGSSGGKTSSKRSGGGKRTTKSQSNSADLEFLKTTIKKPKQDAVQIRLRELESAFIESDEPIDSAHREGMWEEMAIANATLQRRHDSTVCWVNSVWNQAEPDSQRVEKWMACEQHGASVSELDETSLSSVLSSRDAATSNPALVAAFLTWAGSQESTPAIARNRLNELTQYLQSNESGLPIRAAWMSWVALYRMTGNDELLLARARDRVLQRLFDKGMTPEFDMAGFMRTGGGEANDRFRTVREQLLNLKTQVAKWVQEPDGKAEARTRSYCDLVFAFALARLGETKQCNIILDEVAEQFARNGDELHMWACEAYSHRVRQSLAGEYKTDPLPEELVGRLESMQMFDRYKLEKLRNMSLVLEPAFRVDAYSNTTANQLGDFNRDLLSLQNTLGADEIGDVVRELLAKYPEDAHRQQLLPVALQVAPQVDEKLAAVLLDHSTEMIKKTDDAYQLASLLQKSLFVAAHYGRISLVHQIMNSLVKALPKIVESYMTMADSNENVAKVRGIETLFTQSFRGLRKLGMRGEIGDLYAQVAMLSAEKAKLGASARKSQKGRAGDEARPMRLMLSAAAGWFYFGRTEDAREIVDQVRDRLFRGDLDERGQLRLSIAYLNAISQADVDESLRRVEELFVMSKTGKRQLNKIGDNAQTNSHFSISQLELVEQSVLALVSEDFVLSDQSRRWLDEDEFLVRSRIHRDVREATGT